MVSRRLLLRSIFTAVAAPWTKLVKSAERQILQADAQTLRRNGAKLDGVTDDAPAFNRLIRQMCLKGVTGTLMINLPAGLIHLASPVISGDADLIIRGAGPGGTVILMTGLGLAGWQHGSAAKPARGTLALTDLTLVNRSASGGTACLTALSIVFSPLVPDGCLSLRSLRFEGWAQPIHVVDATRGLRCEDVFLFGPDEAMQDDAAFLIESTSQAKRGCFDYSFENVLVSNYRWGWRFSIGATLEGQVFRNCHAYNGQGLLKVVCHVPNYRSLLWAITDCDQEGLGPAIDLSGCRDIIVRGGYYVASRQPHANINADSVPTAIIRLRDCVDVELLGVELDVTPGGPSDLALVWCDGNNGHVRFRDTIVAAYRPLRAGFEWERNVSSNTIGEFNTIWEHWSGGPKVLDHGSNQIAQTSIRDSYLGDVNETGRYDLSGRFTAVATPGHDLIVPFPRRPSDKPYFIGGKPTTTFSVEQQGKLSFSLRSVTQLEMTFHPYGMLPQQVVIDWRASGL